MQAPSAAGVRASPPDSSRSVAPAQSPQHDAHVYPTSSEAAAAATAMAASEVLGDVYDRVSRFQRERRRGGGAGGRERRRRGGKGLELDATAAPPAGRADATRLQTVRAALSSMAHVVLWPLLLLCQGLAALFGSSTTPLSVGVTAVTAVAVALYLPGSSGGAADKAGVPSVGARRRAAARKLRRWWLKLRGQWQAEAALRGRRGEGPEGGARWVHPLHRKGPSSRTALSVALSATAIGSAHAATKGAKGVLSAGGT